MTINPTHYAYTPHNSPVTQTLPKIKEEPIAYQSYESESEDEKEEGQGQSKPIQIPSNTTKKVEVTWIDLYGEY